MTLDAVSDNETAITLTWTPSFNCCVATYNVTINTTQYVVPGSQQGFCIPGLKSNTLYVIVVQTFYCNSSTSVYTREWVKPCLVMKMYISSSSGIAPTKCEHLHYYGFWNIYLFKCHMDCSSMLTKRILLKCFSSSLSFFRLVSAVTKCMKEVPTPLDSRQLMASCALQEPAPSSSI